MRLIDADALEREGWSLCRNYQQDKNTMVYETKSIVEIPTAQPERKKGEWIEATADGIITFDKNAYAECSVCGKKEFLGWRKNFCPNCGADMREVTT